MGKFHSILRFRMELSRYRRALVIVLSEIVFDIIGKLLHFSFCFNNSLSL
jgi:hypothetical protein